MKKAKKTLLKFPDSGEEIYLPNVPMSGLILREQRKTPKPQPPKQKVDYGDGQERWEVNYANPEYKRNLSAWNEFTITEATDQAIAQLYKKTTLNADQLAAVKAWKEANPGDWDETETDTCLWFEQIALSTLEDFNTLTNYLQGIDEEGVDSVQDSFQGNTE